MLKAHKDPVVDQYTDRSGAMLVKIASRMADRGLAAMALDTLFKMDRPLRKQASFPVDSVRDVFLSRIYFEAQREKIAADLAEDINSRLEVRESLYGLPGKITFMPGQHTKEAAQAVELLPLCKIASAEELFQAGQDFSREYENLASADRVAFAKNFVKVAGEYGVELPDAVKLYAAIDVAGRPDAAESVLLRKIAMERQGRGAGGYDILYDNIRGLDIAALPVEELCKLAEAIDSADTAYGLRDSGHGSTIPDAWHSVFQVKKAEVSETAQDAAGMTKADIISRYGEGILEAVEDADGNIDRERLARIVTSLGRDSLTGTSVENA
jgi:hypothetical protein